MAEYLHLSEAEDGKLFKIRIFNTGEVRTARYHWSAIGRTPLKHPCFADPEHPEDYQRWVHDGWGARAVSRSPARS